MIKCPNCTGELDFDVKDEVVKCSYCGSKFNPKELNEKVKMAGEPKKKKKDKEEQESYEGKAYTCSQCGATLMTFDETAITFCSYCGSQAMIESKMMKQNNPDFIIPFKKTKEECIDAYKKKISRSIFAPSFMKSDTVVEKFRGIYIPYCVYKLEHHGRTNNKGSKYSHRSGDYIYYDDYRIEADVDASYEGISYDLISKFYDKFSHALPYNYKEAEDFNPNYLIGFYADVKDVPDDVYDYDAKKIANYDSTAKLMHIKEYGKYGCHDPKLSLGVTSRKIGMFPVYFLAIRDKKNKNVNYAVVNGQTGKVAVDLPLDYLKYILYSLILALIIFVCINNYIVLTPITVCFLTIGFSIMSFVFSLIQINKMKKRMTHSDDMGYKVVNRDKLKEKVKTHAFRHIIKQIIGILIPLLTILSGTISDILIYGSSIIGLILVVLSFGDLVKEHNIIVSNKLPQLEKRGGDEND